MSKMSAYLEVKASKVKSWEEEQLMSLNKVVKDLQDEVQFAKQTETNTKKKLTKMACKNKKAQEALKRLTGEKDALVQENVLLANKIDKLEKEVVHAHNSTINETKTDKSEDEDDSCTEHESSETEKSANELTADGNNDDLEQSRATEAETENNEALKMLEEIRIKMDKLTAENTLLNDELRGLKEKNNTYQEGMIMIKDCFGDCNKSFKEEKNDFIQLFVQSIMDAVNEWKGKIEGLENERDSLNDEIARKEDVISEKKSEYHKLEEDISKNQSDFESALEEVKVQKARIEKAFDQIQSDLNEALLRNQNLENDATTTCTKLAEEKESVDKLQEEKSNLTNEIQELQVDLNAERTKVQIIESENNELGEKCKNLEESVTEGKKTMEILQDQLALNNKLNTDLECQINRAEAHSQSVESENEDLKQRCEKLENQVECQNVEVENEREALKATMRSVEDVLLDKQNQMKEMKDAVSSVSSNNTRLLSQVEAYRKTVSRLERERDEMKLKVEDLQKAFHHEAKELRQQRDEMAQELEFRLEVAQRASDEVLRNEQEVKDQLQSSYVKKLLKAEKELRQKDRALEVAETKLKRTHNKNISMNLTKDSNLCSTLKDDVLEDLEFQLELTRETSAENLRHEREMRDEIQTSYIEKLILTQEILQQKEEMLTAVEKNFQRLQGVNKKLVEDNINALEKIKKLTKEQKECIEKDRCASSYKKEVSFRLDSKDVRSDEYENLLEKLGKLENHLATCAENSASENTRDYHLCRLENIHLQHQNKSLKQLLTKVKSVTGLNDDDFSSLQRCANIDKPGENTSSCIEEKIGALDREFSRFEQEFYDEIDELRRDYSESRKLNEMYEHELRSMARRHGVPVMLLPMYGQAHEESRLTEDNEQEEEEEEEERLESTRAD